MIRVGDAWIEHDEDNAHELTTAGYPGCELTDGPRDAATQADCDPSRCASTAGTGRDLCQPSRARLERGTSLLCCTLGFGIEPSLTHLVGTSTLAAALV